MDIGFLFFGCIMQAQGGMQAQEDDKREDDKISLTKSRSLVLLSEEI